MKLPELVYQDESRNNRSSRVGDRDADPVSYTHLRAHET